MSLLYIERRQTPRLDKGERISIHYIELLLSARERLSLFSMAERDCSPLQKGERQTPPLYNGESISLHEIEETTSLCQGEIVFLLVRGERLLLFAEERASLFSIKRRQTPSLYAEEGAAFFSIERMLLLSTHSREERVSLFSIERRTPSLYKGERLSLL